MLINSTKNIILFSCNHLSTWWGLKVCPYCWQYNAMKSVSPDIFNTNTKKQTEKVQFLFNQVIKMQKGTIPWTISYATVFSFTGLYKQQGEVQLNIHGPFVECIALLYFGKLQTCHCKLSQTFIIVFWIFGIHNFWCCDCPVYRIEPT